MISLADGLPTILLQRLKLFQDGFQAGLMKGIFSLFQEA